VALFRNKSFFQLNRILLLSFPLVSLAIVFIAPHFQDPVYLNTGFTTVLLPELIIGQPAVVGSGAPTLSLWEMIYALGFVISISIFLRGIWQIFTIVRSSEKAKWNDLEFGFSNKADSPFSFFKHIVLPYTLQNDDSLSTVLTHEQVHREEKHSSDNLYYNLLSILFWFNPFIHLMAKELRQTHECIADKKAIENTSREVYAHMLLSSTFGSEVALPANPFFNSSLLKTRITMLYKNESPKWLKWSYLTILPLAAAMTLHACSKNPEQSSKAQNIEKAKSYTYDEVQAPPLFDHCDASAGVQEQKVCFQLGIFNYLSENLKYPQNAYELGIEGTVFVGFVVDKNGSITEVEVKRGVVAAEGASPSEVEATKALSDYAVTLVQSIPKLKSGAKHNDNGVAMEFTIPIKYKLQ
jgi:TonB family protein